MKKQTKEQYLEKYGNARNLKNRHAVYISTETRNALFRLIGALSETGVKTSAFVDIIVKEHFETNEQVIKEIYQEQLLNFTVGNDDD